MFASLQAALAEWGLFALALACFAGAGFAFVYVPVFGRWIASALVALGCAIGAYDLGYAARGKLDNSGAIQAQLDEANRQLAATRDIEAAAAAREESDTRAATQLQEKVDAYEAALKSSPNGDGCSLTDDDVRALGGLSDDGAGAPGPSRAAGGVRPAGGGAKADQGR